MKPPDCRVNRFASGAQLPPSNPNENSDLAPSQARSGCLAVLLSLRMAPPVDPHALLSRFQGAFASGFTAAMKLSLVQLEKDQVVLEMAVGPEHLQPHGLVHGGVFCSLVETAGSIGASLNVAEGLIVVGVENQTSFLRAVRKGKLKSTAKPIHIGRRSQLWETEIVDEKGRLVATGRLRLMNIEQET